jgi:hypothetical protein
VWDPNRNVQNCWVVPGYPSVQTNDAVKDMSVQNPELQVQSRAVAAPLKRSLNQQGLAWVTGSSAIMYAALMACGVRSCTDAEVEVTGMTTGGRGGGIAMAAAGMLAMLAF